MEFFLNVQLCVHFFLFAGQEEWGGQCRSGRRQSPIDLAKDAAIMGRYPSLLFKSYDSVLKNAKIRNTGHSCKLKSAYIHLFYNFQLAPPLAKAIKSTCIELVCIHIC